MITVTVFVVLLLVVLISLVFTLSNGINDASSVVATMITSGAASAKGAVLLAAVFTLVGAVFSGSMVAGTISSVITLAPSEGLLSVIFSAVFGAAVWNIVSWRTGLPSSSTHALVGGIIGAMSISSQNGILWGWNELFSTDPHMTGVVKIVVSLLISPAIGFAAAYILSKVAGFLLRNAKYTINKWIKGLQWAVAAALSYSHGANDTQKILGIIVLALLSAGYAPMTVAPLWAKLSLGVVLSFGTLMGGWKIMKTIGRGIFELKPIHSLSSQLASAGSILAANLTGAPVSSTQTVVGSIMGVGSAENYKMVNWIVVRGILLSWLVAIPASAALSAMACLLFSRIFKIS